MNLTTQTQRQLAAVEAQGDTCLRSLISFAECLNRAHFDFWNKPDDELQPFLQALLDDGNLQTLFADHEYYATTTNAILTRYGSAPICNTGALREFTIVDGMIVLSQPVVVEPEPTPEPEIVVEPELIPDVQELTQEELMDLLPQIVEPVIEE
jgi:hypothetical protein